MTVMPLMKERTERDRGGRLMRLRSRMAGSKKDPRWYSEWVYSDGKTVSPALLTPEQQAVGGGLWSSIAQPAQPTQQVDVSKATHSKFWDFNGSVEFLVNGAWVDEKGHPIPEGMMQAAAGVWHTFPGMGAVAARDAWATKQGSPAVVPTTRPAPELRPLYASTGLSPAPTVDSAPPLAPRPTAASPASAGGGTLIALGAAALWFLNRK